MQQKILLLFCFTVFHSSLVFGQRDFRPGYIVKTGTDTTKGWLAYRLDKKNREECLFRKDRKGATIRYTPSDIDGFGIYSDKRYRSMPLPNDATKKTFAKIAVQGNLSLYQYTNLFAVETKDSLINLPVPKDVVIGPPENKKVAKDSRFIGILNSVMLKCPGSTEGISYSESSLTKRVLEYNRCVSKEPVWYSQRPVGKLRISLFTGYVNSSLTYTTHRTTEDFQIPFKTGTVVGGASFDLSSPRVFDKFFFSFETWFVKQRYEASYTYKFTGDTFAGTMDADFFSLKIPFGIRYNFRKGTTPYLKGGVFWSSTLSKNITTVEHRTTGNTSYNSVAPPKVKNPKGLWAGIGYNLGKNENVFVEFRYERGEGYFGTGVTSASKMHSYNFLMGIRI